MNSAIDLAKYTARLGTIPSALSAAAPWLASYITISPPWPSPTVANCFTLLFQVMIFSTVFSLWRADKYLGARWLAALVMLFLSLVLLMAYLSMFKACVVNCPGTETQIVIGHELSENAKELRRTSPTQYTDEYFLGNGGCNPLESWTRESINSNCVWLVGRWIAFWSAVFFCFALLFLPDEPPAVQGAGDAKTKIILPI